MRIGMHGVSLACGGHANQVVSGLSIKRNETSHLCRRTAAKSPAIGTCITGSLQRLVNCRVAWRAVRTYDDERRVVATQHQLVHVSEVLCLEWAVWMRPRLPMNQPLTGECRILHPQYAPSSV